MKIFVILILSLFLLSCGSSNASKSNYAGKIENLGHLQASPFGLKYLPIQKDGWKLQDGGYNNTFDLTSSPDTSFEIQTKNDVVVSAGFVFYKKEKLNGKDLDLVNDFIQSLDSQTVVSQQTKDLIKTNSAKSVFQIKQAQPISHGEFNIYSGQVANDETISIERKY